MPPRSKKQPAPLANADASAGADKDTATVASASAPETATASEQAASPARRRSASRQSAESAVAINAVEAPPAVDDTVQPAATDTAAAADAPAHTEGANDGVDSPAAGEDAASPAADMHASVNAPADQSEPSDAAAQETAELVPAADLAVPSHEEVAVTAEAEPAVTDAEAVSAVDMPSAVSDSQTSRPRRGRKRRQPLEADASASDSAANANAKTASTRKRSSGRRAAAASKEMTSAAPENFDPASGAIEAEVVKPVRTRGRKSAGKPAPAPIVESADSRIFSEPETSASAEQPEAASPPIEPPAATGTGSSRLSESASEAADGRLLELLGSELKKKERKQTHEKDGVHIRKDLKERLDQACMNRSKGFKTLLLNYGLEKALDELERVEAENRITE
ncbi:hypothetical protein SAMN02799630_04022 [Paenibacillus sp. UNCCL117]|uniref:hypothetical protein n=1 Tax=unclassified Paenibacillus TaxID=185978 RepID=UPI00088F68F6|nr:MULTISPECIES: hypothetical protein [unclassified Paenibacillus]SDD78076.1 hypothetical protein SAMN04488602_11387 [Paenibacillus sp. cl123]SFW52891.1 hypothetical protein SAMN02799630_04022 [Paenibacillus sp. UNCCL117]